MGTLYDLIESEGIDYIKSLPSGRIQKKFRQTPPEELVMYVITGLTSEELYELFSAPVVRTTLRQLPSDDLFTFLFYLNSGKDVERCFEKSTFHQKFMEIDDSIFYEACVLQHSMIFSLFDNGYLTAEKLIKKFKHFSFTKIVRLAKIHPRWSVIVHPLIELVRHSIFPVRNGSSFTGKPNPTILTSSTRAYDKGVRDHIMKFLV